MGVTIQLSLLVKGRYSFVGGVSGVGCRFGIGFGFGWALFPVMLGGTILTDVWVWAGRPSWTGPSVVVGKAVSMLCLSRPKGLGFRLGLELQALDHRFLKKFKVFMLPRTGVRVLLAPQTKSLIIGDGCLVPAGPR